jgi:hypothetical protein
MQSMQSTPATQPVQALEPSNAVPKEESHADKGLRPRRFCLSCEGGEPRCPTCSFQGERIVLDYEQNLGLFEAVYGLEVDSLSYTKPQLERKLRAFRTLLLEHAPWYDGTSLQMIQACFQNLCMRGGTSKNAALAIHFFEEEYKLANTD